MLDVVLSQNFNVANLGTHISSVMIPVCLKKQVVRFLITDTYTNFTCCKNMLPFCYCNIPLCIYQTQISILHLLVTWVVGICKKKRKKERGDFAKLVVVCNLVRILSAYWNDNVHDTFSTGCFMFVLGSWMHLSFLFWNAGTPMFM
jgi:hypothetical protein